MKHSSPISVAFVCLALSLLTAVGQAQTASNSTSLATRAPQHERLEGTLSSTVGGVTTRARLQFEAPDKLRVDIQADDAALISAQTVIASGNQSQLFDHSTRRLQRLPYNVVMQWWRNWSLPYGGPANAALFGWSQATVSPFYTVAAPGATGGESSLTFRAREDAGKRLVQDYVRSGGVGEKLFYAASKRPVFDRPVRMVLTLSQNGLLSTRQEWDEKDRVLSRIDYEWNAATKLPTAATVRDADSQVVAQFKYELVARATPFAATTFQLDATATNQIPEDLELRTIADYQKEPPTADARFNLGVAVARYSEDFDAAYTLWEEAARSQPQAVAPHFATYETALIARDLPRATGALDRLAQILGESHVTVARGRANVASLRRDWTAVETALETAQRAQLQNLGITVQRAELLRGRGDFAAARTLLLDILKSPAPQPLNQIAAAEMLASSVINTAQSREADELLASLPRDTQWQRLARAHLALWQGKTPEDPTFSHPAALASIAQALHRERRDDEALAAWQKLAAGEVSGTPQTLRTLARQNLVALYARRGDRAASMKAYRELIEREPSELARRTEQSMLLAAWRKAFRQEELHPTLEQRTISTSATDDDLRLWLLFQETNGSLESVEAAVRAGVSRFSGPSPQRAWWQSRWAEYLMGQANAQISTGEGPPARARFINDAIQAVDAAIQADPSQPLYPVQKALILVQRGTVSGPIRDAGTGVADRTAASEFLQEVQNQWPNDVDVAIALATQRAVLETKAGDEAVITALSNVLQMGIPGRESLDNDRHVAAFFARQAVALLMRQRKQWDGGATHYRKLLDSSRTPEEQLGIAINYVAMLIEKTDSGAGVEIESLAQLLERVAAQPASYSVTDSLLRTLADLIASRRPLAIQMAAYMRNGARGRQLAAAYLNFALERIAAREASATVAPPETVRALRESQSRAATSEDALKTLVGAGNELQDKFLAGRAAALLGERAMASGDPGGAATWLQTAVRTEPRDINLRIALAKAYLAANRTVEALAVRDDILKALPRNGLNLRQVALLSARLDLADEAARYAGQSMSLTQIARDANPAQLEISAFVLARALLDAGNLEQATDVYNRLSGTQWSTGDRAAALLDFERRLRASGKASEADQVRQRLNNLNPTPRDLELAEQFLGTIEL